MKNIFSLLFALTTLACLADGPVVQTTPLTRQLLRAPDAGTARSVLGVLATNNWPVTNVTLYAPAVQGGTSSGLNNSNPTNNGGVYTNGSFTGGTFSGGTNNNGVYSNGLFNGGSFTNGTFNGSSNNNPVISGGSLNGTTNLFSLNTGPVTVTWSNSPTIDFASRRISEGFLKSTRPVPITWYNTWLAYGYGVTETNVLNDLVQFQNAPEASLGTNFYYFLWGVAPTNAALSPTGTFVDTNGIIQVDTNRFPHGLAWLAQQVHNAGFSFGYGIILGPQDSYPVTVNVGDNAYGNAMFAITNYGVDTMKGHGDWTTSPATSFDQEIQMQLACADSGKKVQFHPEDCWSDPSNSYWLKYYWPDYTKFFSAVEVLSGSGFPDVGPNGLAELPLIRSQMLYFMTNFSTGVSPGHWWNQMPFQAVGSTIGDPIWRVGKVGASISAMSSAGFCVLTDSSNMLYQSVQCPVDVIQRVDQDPLMLLPKLKLSTNNAEVWVKRMQNSTYALWPVNWDTNSPQTIAYTLSQINIPTNGLSGYFFYDCWSNQPDWFFPSGAILTNSLQSGDCDLYVLTPVPLVTTGLQTNLNYVNPLNYGLNFDVPLNEGPGSTSVGNYAVTVNSTNYSGLSGTALAQSFATIAGVCLWTNSNVGEAIFSSNAAPSYSSTSTMSNCIQAPSIPALNNAGAFTIDLLFAQPSIAAYPVLFSEISTTGIAVYLQAAAPYLEFSLATSQTNLSTYVSSPGTINDGNWHEMAAVYSGTNFTLYVDGTALQSWAASGTLGNPPFSTAYIGAMMGGKTAHPRIWSRALTATEVKLIYRQSFPP